jgi:hypothetical protein
MIPARSCLVEKPWKLPGLASQDAVESRILLDLAVDDPMDVMGDAGRRRPPYEVQRGKPADFLLDGTSFTILGRPAADKRRRSGRTH